MNYNFKYLDHFLSNITPNYVELTGGDKCILEKKVNCLLQ